MSLRPSGHEAPLGSLNRVNLNQLLSFFSFGASVTFRRLRTSGTTLDHDCQEVEKVKKKKSSISLPTFSPLSVLPQRVTCFRAHAKASSRISPPRQKQSWDISTDSGPCRVLNVKSVFTQDLSPPRTDGRRRVAGGLVPSPFFTGPLPSCAGCSRPWHQGQDRQREHWRSSCLLETSRQRIKCDCRHRRR